MDELDTQPRTGPPSVLMMVGPPIGLCALVVLVAWMHTALGSPLGPAFGAEVWGLAKMAIASTVAATAFGAWARRQNEHNLQVLEARRDLAAMSGATLPRTRTTGPHKVLTSSGPHRSLSQGRRVVVVEPEVVEDDEGDDRW